eukprot:3132754-Rhodomonas_salina.5
MRCFPTWGVTVLLFPASVRSISVLPGPLSPGLLSIGRAIELRWRRALWYNFFLPLRIFKSLGPRHSRIRTEIRPFGEARTGPIGWRTQQSAAY